MCTLCSVEEKVTEGQKEGAVGQHTDLFDTESV